jgi:hypothetical protein
MPEVVVELDTIDPQLLMGERTPDGVWLRVNDLHGPGGGNPVVQIRGEYQDVKRYVDEHWGLADLPDFDELVDLAQPPSLPSN